MVHWSKEPPESALLSVEHRGKWSFIEDSDHISKRFFNLLYDLFTLEIAPSGSGGTPILTLPIN